MKMLNTNQVVFENVTAKYPRINQTYKYDTYGKQDHTM